MNHVHPPTQTQDYVIATLILSYRFQAGIGIRENATLLCEVARAYLGECLRDDLIRRIQDNSIKMIMSLLSFQ